METKYPVIYYESKAKAFKWLFVFVIIILGGFTYEDIKNTSDSIFSSTFILGLMISFIVISLLLYFYPISTLEIYEDHFIYKKGKVYFVSPWADVKHFALQYLSWSLRARSRQSSFFISTLSRKTGLIDTRTLKVKEGGKVNIRELMKQIEFLSHTRLEHAEYSSNDYKGVFVDIDSEF